jgi:hypothetical protein
MKRVIWLVSTGILFTILGCSGNSQKATYSTKPGVVLASSAPATSSEATAAIPVPLVEKLNQQAWRSENIKDHLGNAVALKGVSSDGKFDLVILQRGTHSFISFVKHDRWKQVHEQPGKAKLMYLRVKFEDGQEKHIEWDELGFATDNLYSVLWSYPAKTGAQVDEHLGDSVGGDQLLIQDMLKHQAMILEIEPGGTAQFDLSGFAQQIEKSRTLETKPSREAGQTAQ